MTIKVSGACQCPLSINPYVTAQTAADHTLELLLNEATKWQFDQNLHPTLQGWYRRASSIYWLEMLRRGTAATNHGLDVIYGQSV